MIIPTIKTKKQFARKLLEVYEVRGVKFEEEFDNSYLSRSEKTVIIRCEGFGIPFTIEFGLVGYTYDTAYKFAIDRIKEEIAYILKNKRKD